MHDSSYLPSSLPFLLALSPLNTLNSRLALKINRDAFETNSSFWAALLKPKIQLRTLTKKVAELDACVEEAIVSYKQLLQRSPDNWMLLRMYAVFLELIKNDPWGAAKNYA